MQYFSLLLMVFCFWGQLFALPLGWDKAAGLLYYAKVLGRPSGSPFISLRKADQRHDLASLVGWLWVKTRLASLWLFLSVIFWRKVPVTQVKPALDAVDFVFLEVVILSMWGRASGNAGTQDRL